jgi:hypothetical protein
MSPIGGFSPRYRQRATPPGIRAVEACSFLVAGRRPVSVKGPGSAWERSCQSIVAEWGRECLGLNGGPVFKHNEAFSFQIATENQEETDRYWNAIVGHGGQESQCGWCKDKWGISWQITPRVLTDALAAGGDEAKRAFDAMMGMKKIDVAAIEAARRG